MERCQVCCVLPPSQVWWLPEAWYARGPLVRMRSVCAGCDPIPSRPAHAPPPPRVFVVCNILCVCFSFSWHPVPPHPASFVMTDDGSGGPCHGVAGIMQAYANTLRTVTLSGPTLFTQIIQQAAATAASACVHQGNQKYFVLLIITDGRVFCALCRGHAECGSTGHTPPSHHHQHHPHSTEPLPLGSLEPAGLPPWAPCTPCTVGVIGLPPRCHQRCGEHHRGHHWRSGASPVHPYCGRGQCRLHPDGGSGRRQQAPVLQGSDCPAGHCAVRAHARGDCSVCVFCASPRPMLVPFLLLQV